MKKLTLLFILTIACSQLGVFADSSYSVQSLPTPAGTVCEVTGLDYSDDGTLYICTRRGMYGPKRTETGKGLPMAYTNRWVCLPDLVSP